MRHDVVASGDGRQREAAGDGLAERAKIGRYAVQLLRAAVGEPEACNHLVEYEGDAELGREVAQSPEEAGLRRYQSLERLYDDAAR